MQPTSPNKQRSGAGFTLVEMLVVAPFVLLIIGGFIALIITLTGQVLSQSGQNKLVYDTQNAFDRFNQDVIRASAFQKASVTPLSPQGADDSSKPFNTDNPLPGDSGATYGTIAILEQPAITKSPADGSRELVYSKAPNPNACGTASENQNKLYKVEIVYYLKADGSDKSIWRRTMFDSSQVPCSGSSIWQRASCTPDATSATCQTDDEMVLDHVSDVAVVYLKNGSSNLVSPSKIDFGGFVDCINPCTQDPNNPSVPYNISHRYDPFSPSPDSHNAKNIKLYIKTERTVAGRDLSYEGVSYSHRRAETAD